MASQTIVVVPSRRIRLRTLRKDPNAVDTTSVAYDEMWADWELIEDLCKGRDRMIEQNKLWLPQEPGEEEDKYLLRLYRTFLFGGFVDTLERLSTKPFSREVTVRNAEQLSEQLVEMLRNVDRHGTSVTAFSKGILKDGIEYGHGLVYVDYPVVAQDPQNPITLAQQRSLGLRPYWIKIVPSDLLGWRTEHVDGKERLVQIRYKTERVVPDGRFGDKKVEVVRVVTAPPLTARQIAELGPDNLAPKEKYGTVEEWVKEHEREGFKLIEESRRFQTYPGIPLVWLPVMPSGKGLLRSKPPLKELAELNLEHWQKSSDLSNILRFVSIAMVLLTGSDPTGGASADNTETGGPDELTWGVNSFIERELGADGKYIEHSGQGIGSLFKHISSIEERMETLGMQPLMAKQVDVTATSQRRDDLKVTSQLQSWIRALENTLLRCTKVAARWIGEEIPTTGDETTDLSFDVFSEFGLRVLQRDDADQLLQARNDRQLSRETFLSEWQKRGIIGEEIIISEEISRIESEEEENDDGEEPVEDDSGVTER